MSNSIYNIYTHIAREIIEWVRLVLADRNRMKLGYGLAAVGGVLVSVLLVYMSVDVLSTSYGRDIIN